MKKIVVLLALTVFVFSACENGEKADRKAEEGKYLLTFNFKKDFDGNVQLFVPENGQLKLVDSASVRNNTVSFEGSVSEPKVHYALFNNRRPYLPIYIENGTITVEIHPDSISAATIKGSHSQEVIDNFMKGRASFDKKLRLAWDKIQQAQRQGDEAALSLARLDFDSLEYKSKSYVLDYVLQNANEPAAGYILIRSLNEYEYQELEPVVERLGQEVLNTEYGKEIIKYVNTLKATSIGEKAPDFTMNDPEGNPVSLSDFRGKYVLIDFWAAWCKPCRAENPNVVAAYQKYHDKGFTVLGVSLDKKKEDWLQAIKDDNLTWTHVSDLKYWDNAAAELYGIRSIPSNVLIDPEGIILAKNIRGKALHETLEEVLNK